jgi:hypothetical protein
VDLAPAVAVADKADGPGEIRVTGVVGPQLFKDRLCLRLLAPVNVENRKAFLRLSGVVRPRMLCQDLLI